MIGVPLVGRQSAAAELVRQLEDARNSVVLLWRQSGVGKTALANIAIQNLESRRFNRPTIRYSAFIDGQGCSRADSLSAKEWLLARLFQDLDPETRLA